MRMYMKRVQISMQIEFAAANNGKGLDVAHGQRYLPINPLLNFIIGGRVDNSPSATGTGYDVSADGYVSKTPRPFTGIPPAIGMKGGSNLAFGLRNNLNEFSEAEGLLNYRQFTSGGFKPKEILSAIENQLTLCILILRAFQNIDMLSLTLEQFFLKGT